MVCISCLFFLHPTIALFSVWIVAATRQDQRVLVACVCMQIGAIGGGTVVTIATDATKSMITAEAANSRASTETTNSKSTAWNTAAAFYAIEYYEKIFNLPFGI